MKSHAFLRLPSKSLPLLKIAVKAAYDSSCQWLRELSPQERATIVERFRKVRYHKEDPDSEVETVKTLDEVLEDPDNEENPNDCEDISGGWAAIETVIFEIPCEPVIINPHHGTLHCVCVYEDGSLFDPNILAGMR